MTLGVEMYLILCVMSAAVLSVLRLRGNKSQSFQAVAHLFVGGLVGSILTCFSWWLLCIALVISAVEVFAFFWFMGQPEGN
jgi:L-asparagine transporter-like permease